MQPIWLYFLSWGLSWKYTVQQIWQHSSPSPLSSDRIWESKYFRSNFTILTRSHNQILCGKFDGARHHHPQFKIRFEKRIFWIKIHVTNLRPVNLKQLAELQNLSRSGLWRKYGFVGAWVELEKNSVVCEVHFHYYYIVVPIITL